MSKAHAVKFELQDGSLDEELPLEITITQGLAFMECHTEGSGRCDDDGCVSRVIVTAGGRGVVFISFVQHGKKQINVDSDLTLRGSEKKVYMSSLAPFHQRTLFSARLHWETLSLNQGHMCSPRVVLSGIPFSPIFWKKKNRPSISICRKKKTMT